MKRKIIKLGQATYVLSLPSKWIRNNGLEKGDYLEVEENANHLAVSTKKISNKLEITLEQKNFNTRLLSMFIQTYYKLGYDKINIIHEPEIKQYMTGKNINTSQFIQQLVNSRFVGAEIVEQTEKRTVIMDLGGVTDQTSKEVFTRIIFLIKTIMSDSLKGIKEKNIELLESIQPRWDNVSRFLMHYQRAIAKTNSNTQDYVFRVQQFSNLKLLNGTYRHIAKEAIGVKCDFTTVMIKILEQANNSLEHALSLCLSFNSEKAVELITKREKLVLDIDKVRTKLTTNDLFLLGWFGELRYSEYGILKATFSLNQLQKL